MYTYVKDTFYFDVSITYKKHLLIMPSPLLSDCLKRL